MRPSDDILRQSLPLPATERARIAHELLRSLDESDDSDAADLWLAEIEKRADAVENGAPLHDWSEVRAAILRRLRR